MPKEIPAALQRQLRAQGGVVTRSQAIRAGLSAGEIQWLLRRGSWRQLHRGVYATFAGAVARNARLWAAVLYAGRDACLSHATAAEINRLTDGESAVIDVTISASRRVRPTSGVRIHHSRRKPMVWRPPGTPPFTIAEETVIDLAQAATSSDDVIALITSGFGRRLLAEPYLRRAVAGRRKLRWRRELDEGISIAPGGAHSVLEYRYDRDVQRAHGLPEPVRQARFTKEDGTNGYRDRCYPQYGGLVIELDGKRYHADDQLDRRRDNQAAVTAATLRYDWSDVTRMACETARQQAEALRNRGWTGSLRPCSPACRAMESTPSGPAPASRPAG